MVMLCHVACDALKSHAVMASHGNVEVSATADITLLEGGRNNSNPSPMSRFKFVSMAVVWNVEFHCSCCPLVQYWDVLEVCTKEMIMLRASKVLNLGGSIFGQEARSIRLMITRAPSVWMKLFFEQRSASLPMIGKPACSRQGPRNSQWSLPSINVNRTSGTQCHLVKGLPLLQVQAKRNLPQGLATRRW